MPESEENKLLSMELAVQATDEAKILFAEIAILAYKQKNIGQVACFLHNQLSEAKDTIAELDNKIIKLTTRIKNLTKKLNKRRTKMAVTVKATTKSKAYEDPQPVQSVIERSHPIGNELNSACLIQILEAMLQYTRTATDPIASVTVTRSPEACSSAQLIITKDGIKKTITLSV